MTGSVRFTDDWRAELKQLIDGRPALVLVSREIATTVGFEPLSLGKVHFVVDGENQKEWSTVVDVSETLGEIALPRDGVIVGIGGGATTDLAGFIASIWMRGIDWVAIPTTLAAMVDAAIGGKTGINTVSGKNLIGSFHLPIATIVDQGFLRTLEARDLNAGMAEVIKCGLIADPAILNLAESLSGDWVGGEVSSPFLAEMISRSVAVKQRIVSEDLTEQGSRAFLNYGHTLGHAIERASDFSLRHGEAIAIGLVFAARLSQAVHALPDSIVARHVDLLNRYHLPTSWSGNDFETLLAFMQRDKKVKDGRMRFVTLRDLADPEVTSNIDVALLRRTFLEGQNGMGEAR